MKNMVDHYHHSPGGHKIHFAHPDHRPVALKFDKGRTHYGTPLVYSCIMEGTTGFELQSWNQFCG